MRRAADVDAVRIGGEDDRPAAIGRTPHPVDLLAEEEVALVEPADLVERGATDKHARPHHPVHLALARVVEPGSVEGVQRARPRGELPQVEELGGEPPRGREAAHRPLQRPVRVEQARRDERRPRMPAGRVDEPRERVLDEPGVCVEHEDVVGSGLCDAPVPARCEAAVLGLDDANGREPVPDDGDRVVRGGVVYDDGVDPGDALEASLDPRQRVVRDHDARDGARVLTHAPPVCASRAPPRRGGSARPATRGGSSRGRTGNPQRTPCWRGRRRSPGS